MHIYIFISGKPVFSGLFLFQLRMARGTLRSRFRRRKERLRRHILQNRRWRLGIDYARGVRREYIKWFVYPSFMCVEAHWSSACVSLFNDYDVIFCRIDADGSGLISLEELAVRLYEYMLGGWVNPHREQQTIPQGQTSLPPKSFSTPTANGQSAPRTGSARGVGRRGEPHTEHGLGLLLAHEMIHISYSHIS